MGISRIRYNDTLRFTKGTRVYLDTNFLLAIRIDDDKLMSSEKLTNAKKLFKKLLVSKAELVLSPLVLDESWYIHLKLLYEKDNGRGSWRRDRPLKNKPCFISAYRKELKEFTESLFSDPRFEFVNVTQEVAEKAFLYMVENCFGPRDSFHLAMAIQSGINKFVTIDRDFKTGEEEDIDLTVIKYSS